MGQKQFPLWNVVGVANERAGWKFLRRARDGEQAKTCLVWHSIGLPLIHVLGIKRFHLHACASALEEGFEVQTRKTRIMRRAVAQKAGGLVLNDRANVPRRVYEELKAILYNCVRHGPAGENRNAHPDFRGHLRGRIAHVERVHPRHAEKLRVTFDKIIWDSPS